MPKPFWIGEDRAWANSLLANVAPDSGSLLASFAPPDEFLLRAVAAKARRTWPNDQPIRWTDISEALSDIRSEKPTVNDLEKAFQTSIDTYWRSRSKTEVFTVAIAVEGVLPERSTTLRVHVYGLEFDLYPYDDFHKHIEVSPSHRTSDVKMALASAPPAFAYSKFQACSGIDAIDKAMEAFTLWRGAANLASTFGRQLVQFTPSPRCAIAAPRWCLCFGSGEPLVPNSYGCIPLVLPERSPTPIQGLTLAHAQKLLTDLGQNPPKSSIESLITDCIRIVGLALDQPNWYSALLLLWNLAEHLTLVVGTGTAHHEICRRLPLMSHDLEPTRTAARQMALAQVMDIRHQVVHRAALHGAEDSDVSFLLRSCSNAIHWLFHNRQRLPTHPHLAEYFRLVGMDAASLARTKQVLEYFLVPPTQ